MDATLERDQLSWGAGIYSDLSTSPWQPKGWAIVQGQIPLVWVGPCSL